MARKEGSLVLTPELMAKLGITPEKLAEVKEAVYMAEMKAIRLEDSQIEKIKGFGADVITPNNSVLFGFHGYKAGEFGKEKGAFWFRMAKPDQKAWVPSEVKAQLDATLAIMRDNLEKAQALSEYLDTL